MFIHWRVSYVDSGSKQFRQRDIWLDTSALPPEQAAVVEYDCEESQDRGWRSMIRHRRLFLTDPLTDDELQAKCVASVDCSMISIHGYVEDESGQPLSDRQVAEGLTGNPGSVIVPSGADEHDVDYWLGARPTIDAAALEIAPECAERLHQFRRDLRELAQSTFLQERPETLHWLGSTNFRLETRSSREEFTSFLIAFRRLHVEKEPATLLKVLELFATVVALHPLCTWLKAEAESYRQILQDRPTLIPLVGEGGWPLSRIRTIYAWIYTREAHQAQPERLADWQKCIEASRGNADLALFVVMWIARELGRRVVASGNQVVRVFERWCEHSGSVPRLLATVEEFPGVGALEKDADRRKRLRAEQVDKLSRRLWEANGRPPGGPLQYLDEAERRFDDARRGRAVGSDAPDPPSIGADE